MIFPNPFRFLSSVFFSLWGRFRGYQILATDTEAAARIETCWKCEHLEQGWEPQCRLCTCFIDAKAMLLLEQCPKKKWLRIYKKVDTIRE